MTVDARSASVFLFVPGDRPDRFAKAGAAGPDAVLLDLEDAVAPAAKDAAREQVRRWLAGGGDAVVRINGTGTSWHEADLAMAADLGATVMLPKAEDPEAVATVAAALPGTGVIPLVETAAGVLAAPAVSAAAGVVRTAFGNVDLAAQLGVDPADHLVLQQARQTLVLAAAAAGIGAPVDGVTTAVHDAGALLDDLQYAVRLGFTAKLCVHPRQVQPARVALRPTPEQLEWARTVVARAEESVAVLDGQMIDKPVVDRALALLSRAGHEAPRPDRPAQEAQ
jgi:citrate lyase subunit beta/citryl-CoA lyase